MKIMEFEEFRKYGLAVQKLHNIADQRSVMDEKYDNTADWKKIAEKLESAMTHLNFIYGRTYHAKRIDTIATQKVDGSEDSSLPREQGSSGG